MARDGLFDDLDIPLAWHPDTRTRANRQGSQAILDLTVEFRGKAAHAARAMAATMVDLYEDPATRKAIREEFEASTRGHRYRSDLPDGPPPVPARRSHGPGQAPSGRAGPASSR